MAGTQRQSPKSVPASLLETIDPARLGAIAGGHHQHDVRYIDSLHLSRNGGVCTSRGRNGFGNPLPSVVEPLSRCHGMRPGSTVRFRTPIQVR